MNPPRSPLSRPLAPSAPESVVRNFLDAIARRDVDDIIALLTDDHQFIDSTGCAVTGLDTLRAAWSGYFSWFPNYEVHARQILTAGDTVAIFGQAGGTFSEGRGTIGDNTWLLPAAWRAVVRQDRLALWQVYCDTEPVWTIMRGPR